MRAIVLLYEDAYHAGLHRLVQALRRGTDARPTILEARSARGSGGFVSEVGPQLRAPLKQTRRPPDLVVCVADADRPTNLAPLAAGVPDDPSALDTWVRELERAWHASLVERARIDEGTAARLRTLVLRWNKESLLVACPDALVAYGERSSPGKGARVEALMAACIPAPRSIADAAYTLEYRDPARCIEQIARLVHDRSYKKGLHDEDLLLNHVVAHELHRAQVLARVPDLQRLVALLSRP